MIYNLNLFVFFWQQFQGNYDRYSVRTHAFRPALLARYVRVNPRRWHGWMSMRLELYGGRWGKQLNLFYKDLYDNRFFSLVLCHSWHIRGKLTHVDIR